jgi:SAM-dependent methyltransferase
MSQRLASKFGRYFVDLIRSPIRTLGSTFARLESLRMRVRGNSIFRRPQDLVHASNCPGRMLDRVLEMWRPTSVLDVGCGTGKVIDYLLAKGIADVFGIEGSRAAIDASNRPELVREVDLAVPVDLKRRFDLVYSLEVAEHIHPKAADEFVQTLVRHGDRILLSAARPGQGGLGHLNEQESAYWVEKLRHHGFGFDEEATRALKDVRDQHYENLMVFVRSWRLFGTHIPQRT